MVYNLLYTMPFVSIRFIHSVHRLLYLSIILATSLYSSRLQVFAARLH